MLNSISFSSAGVTEAGAVIQPSRQPVIDQVLEKLLTTITRSSGSAICRKLGATARSYTMRA